jgi:hypothetical protein
MKFEVEVSESEIKTITERSVRTAISNHMGQWGSDKYIKDQVKHYWTQMVDQLIQGELQNSEALREKVRAEIERKLRAQVSAAIREGAKKWDENPAEE